MKKDEGRANQAEAVSLTPRLAEAKSRMGNSKKNLGNELVFPSLVCLYLSLKQLEVVRRNLQEKNSIEART